MRCTLTEVSDTNEKNTFTDFLFKANQYILPLAVVGLFGFCWNTNSRLIALETNDLERRVVQLETNSPPTWLLEDIAEIKTSQKEIRDMLYTHVQLTKRHER